MPGSYTYATDGTPSARGPYVDSIRCRIAFGSTDIVFLIGRRRAELSLCGEECTQQFGGLFGEHAGRHDRAVVEARLAEDVEDATGGAGLGVVRAVHDPR